MAHWGFMIFAIVVVFAVIASYIYDSFQHLNEENFHKFQETFGKNSVPREKGSERHHTELPWCEILRNKYEVILNEYIQYQNDHEIQSATYYDETQASIDKDYTAIPWLTLPIHVYGLTSKKIKHFPETSQLVNKVPGMVQWFFSILLPGKR